MAVHSATVNTTVTTVTSAPADGAVKRSREDRLRKLKIDFDNKAIEVMRAIVKDNLDRMAGCQKDRSLFTKGIWYANDYFEALRKAEPNGKRMRLLLQYGSFYHGFCPKEFFACKRKKDSPTGYEVQHYTIKAGVAPSDALRAAEIGLIFLDCTKTIHLAWLKATLHILGKEKFDALFASNGPCPLTFANQGIIVHLIQHVTVAGRNAFQRGQYGHFCNVTEYQYKHDNGEAMSLSTLCTDGTEGARKFLGLGVPPDCTLSQIDQALLSEYNREPVGTDILSEEAAKKQLSAAAKGWYAQVESLRKHTFTIEDFVQIETGHRPNMMRGGVYTAAQVNIERIDQLAQASLEDARKLVQQWVQQDVFRGSPARSDLLHLSQEQALELMASLRLQSQ